MNFYRYTHDCIKSNGVKIRIEICLKGGRHLRRTKWIINNVWRCSKNKKTHKSIKDELSRKFRYMGLSNSESMDLLRQGLFEYAEKDNVINALNAAWLNMQPTLSDVLN